MDTWIVLENNDVGGLANAEEAAVAEDRLQHRRHLVDALVTHRFPIEDAPEAFRVASDKSTGALRVVIEPNP